MEIEPKFVDVAVVRYMAGRNNSNEGVYLIRDGKKLTYADALAAMEAETVHE